MVIDLTSDVGMRNLHDGEQKFKHFPGALYATDVAFQQSFRPSGMMEEGQIYFSGKHKLYGVKVEVSVLPNGIAVGCTNHFPGSVSDFEILQRNLEWHRCKLNKREGDDLILDSDESREVDKKRWALFVDKGYQGIFEILRGIHPRKKPVNGTISVSDEVFNKNVSSDRITVEILFGSLVGLWYILRFKWIWKLALYNDFFKFCVALTNYHVALNPLRSSDAQRNNQLRNRLSTIANNNAERRRSTVERYRQNRNVRMNQQFRLVQHTVQKIGLSTPIRRNQVQRRTRRLSGQRTRSSLDDVS